MFRIEKMISQRKSLKLRGSKSFPKATGTSNWIDRVKVEGDNFSFQQIRYKLYTHIHISFRLQTTSGT